MNSRFILLTLKSIWMPFHNLNEFRRFLRPGTRIMAMVKAFAYGSGPAEIASLLEFHRVSYLAVPMPMREPNSGKQASLCLSL